MWALTTLVLLRFVEEVKPMFLMNYNRNLTHQRCERNFGINDVTRRQALPSGNHVAHLAQPCR